MTRTCAPAASGIRPPLSSRRPALVSRSVSFCIASASAGGGGAWPWSDLTMNMKRISRAPSSSEPGHPPWNRLACLLDERGRLGSTGGQKIIGGSQQPPQMPEHNEARHDRGQHADRDRQGENGDIAVDAQREGAEQRDDFFAARRIGRPGGKRGGA